MPPAVSSLLSLPSNSQSVLEARDPPTEREKVPRADTSLLGPPLKKLLGVSLLRRARRERCQLDKVAAVQREVGDLLGGDHLAEGWVRGLDRDFRARPRPPPSRRPTLALSEKLISRCLVDLQLQILGLGRLKALKFDMDGVHSDGQVIHDVVPGLIRLGITNDTRTLGSDCNGGPHDSGAGFIRNRSEKLPMA